MANNDWLTQTQELMQTWTEGATGAVGELALADADDERTACSEEWKQAVTAWKDVMQRSLNAQADFVKFWSESMTAMPLMGKQMEDMSTLIVETTQRWTNVQNEIWSNWLDAVAKADAAAMAQNWDEGTRKAFDAWRETVNSAIEAQRKMMESWMSSAGDKKE
jgi:hypothetical protein